MNNELIERVARAIHHDLCGPGNSHWDTATEATR